MRTKPGWKNWVVGWAASFATYVLIRTLLHGHFAHQISVGIPDALGLTTMSWLLQYYQWHRQQKRRVYAS